MAKTKMTENQLKNLIPFSKRSQAERRELGKKGAEKTNEIKALKKQEEKEIEKSADILIRCLKQPSKNNPDLNLKEGMILSLLSKALKGDIKAIELILKLLDEFPTDKKEIIGSLDIQKVFITAKEQEETNKHIDKIIEESFKNGG